MKKQGAVFFDLDGTLVDTSQDILRSLSHAAITLGFDEIHFSRDLIGLPARIIFARAITHASEYEIEKLYMAFRKHHDNTRMTSWKSYAGLDDLLNVLNNEKILYRIITNRPRTGVLNLYESGFKSIPLNYYYCVGDSGSTDKVDLLRSALVDMSLDKNRCLAFGDQSKDIEAAFLCNIRGIFCSYGFGVCENRMNPIAESLSGVKEMILKFFVSSGTQDNYTNPETL